MGWHPGDPSKDPSEGRCRQYAPLAEPRGRCPGDFCGVSCEDSKTPEGTTQKKRTTEEQARDIDFGPWMSNAGLMFAQEQLAPEDYFAEIEGRVSKGENQYRAITKTLNTDEILSAEAIWGMEAGPLCQYEIARLRKGMERSKSHVFTDTTGKAIHQLIMVLPKVRVCCVCVCARAVRRARGRIGCPTSEEEEESTRRCDHQF